jgi:hypothetical protein
MPEQQLDNYTVAFKDAPWETRESAHYSFHYFKGSLAEREIENIVQAQESAYAHITKFLGLLSYPEQRISYYLYPDSQTKEHLMGSPWFAQAIYDDFTIHALYTEQHKVTGPHEDMHLLSLPLGFSIGFLQEGLAEYMVGHDWYGNPFDEVVQDAQKDRAFKILGDLPTSHQAWLNTDDTYARQYYSLAALFTGFLIKTYGKGRYFTLYTSLTRERSKSANEARYIELFNVSAKDLLKKSLTR